MVNSKFEIISYMPIIDPSLNLSLLRYSSRVATNGITYLYKFLKIASDNISQNSRTLESSLLFLKDLQKYPYFDKFKEIIQIYNMNFNINIYQALIEHLHQNDKSFDEYLDSELEGKYYIVQDKSNMRYFQPNSLKSNAHHWLLSNSSIAILYIDTSLLKGDELKEILYLCFLESDIMIGCGFTIVLSIFIDKDLDKQSTILSIELTHRFSEVHFGLEFGYYGVIGNYEFILNYLQESYSSSYYETNLFYFYCPFFVKTRINIKNQDLKLLKELPLFYCIYISNSMKNSFREKRFEICKPFVYCKNGFDYKYISVRLSNVPLYNSEDENNDFTPSEISGFVSVFVSPDDYLNTEKMRVKVLFNNEKNNNRYVYKYVNTTDLYLVRPEFNVHETFFLKNISKDTFSLINEIKKRISQKDMKADFKRKTFFSFFTNQKIEKGIEYVIYAYSHYAESYIDNFTIHRNQIYTALEACQFLFSNDNDYKGYIYQVETGEGKSCIIQIIAAALALLKKTVHITSSNIKLAIRDYYISLPFFQKLGIETALFLHYNELPYITIDNLFKENTDYDLNNFPSKYFNENLFKNSANMNFSVCGIDADNKLTSNKADIVFSTFINMECLYLRMMEMCPSYITKYFKECVLLIDEADSILIDELANGTIISHSVKSNQKDILMHVYKSKMKNKSIDDVYSEVKKNWPKCEDLKRDDIEEMYKEIELVNNDEFENGKKYSIETFQVKEKKSLIKKIKSKLNNEKPKTYKEIICFDYDHNGILEPNKEFNGFIQQFIAIKEILNNTIEN